MADEEKKAERAAKEEKQRHWLDQKRVERRIPENAFIRRRFKLADSVLSRKGDSDKPKN